MKLNSDQSSSIPEKSGAHLVAAGIFLSRIAGLVRQRVFAHYFGNSDAGDAFYSALKIPNFLQNLFGEGVLSASFIPVYSGLIGKEELKEAEKVARIIGTVLALVTSLLVLLGIWQTPHLIGLIAPGFTGEKRELTIRLVQVFFPGTGMLVMSAWCLGILNSHRKFFLSYAAPVLWNVAIIAALLFYGKRDTQNQLALHTAWGLVLGSALQFGIQIPAIRTHLKSFKPALSFKLPSVQSILKNFVPVVIARGVVQVSAYVDNVLASYLPSGAVSSLAYAQLIYMLPISLFGMAVSAAELPAMSRASGTTEEIAAYLRKRIDAGLKQISFFIVPAAIAFIALGDLIVGALYQTGEFTAKNSNYVWAVLAGSSVGLLASTLGRLYSSAFYSLKDTKTPLRFAVIRVTLTIVLGYLCGLRFPVWFGFDPAFGTVGLTASAGIAGWLEFLLLRHRLNLRIGNTGLPLKLMVKLWSAAVLSALFAFFLKKMIGFQNPVVRAGLVLVPYGIFYLLFTYGLGVEASRKWVNRLLRRKNL